jgi:hypothetical protein
VSPQKLRLCRQLSVGKALPEVLVGALTTEPKVSGSNPVGRAHHLAWIWLCAGVFVDGHTPHLRMCRAIVKRAVVAAKSRHGERLIPLTPALAPTLRVHRPREASDDGFVFRGRGGGPADQGSLRPRVLVLAAVRAGLTGVGFHTLRQRASGGRLVSMIRPLRLALQVVLFFVLLSVVVAIGSAQTGNVEKVALIAAGAVLVWPA